jgi:hypothetical protein
MESNREMPVYSGDETSIRSAEDTRKSTLKHEPKRWVQFYFLLWSLGAGLLWWLVMPIYQYARHGFRTTKHSRDSKYLMFLGLWLLGILFVSSLAGQVDFSRIPGAAYGALVWVSVSILFKVLGALDAQKYFNFIRGVFWVGSIQGVFSVIAVIIHPSPLSQFKLPTGIFFGDTSGPLATWFSANLAYVDYFGGTVIRSAGLMGTAAWSGGFACLVLIYLILDRKSLLSLGMRNHIWFMILSLNLASLTLSYSRTSWAILLLVLFTNFIFRLNRRITGGFFISLLLMISFIWGATFFNLEFFLTQQDSLRPGSSVLRFSSYSEAFTVAFDNGIINLIFGNGAKPYLESLGFGIGSESTFISLLVRGGLVALIAIILFFASRASEAVRNKDWTSFSLISALVVHALIEDLDIGSLTIIMGILSGLSLKQDPRVERPQVFSPDGTKFR